MICPVEKFKSRRTGRKRHVHMGSREIRSENLQARDHLEYLDEDGESN